MGKRNKTVAKLRKYRDQLIMYNVDLEHEIRMRDTRFREIREALTNDDKLRAYTLANIYNEFDEEFLCEIEVTMSEAVRELTLVYRMLVTEREFTSQTAEAIRVNDWLRARALTEEHMDLAGRRDQLLKDWTKQKGLKATIARLKEINHDKE